MTAGTRSAASSSCRSFRAFLLYVFGGAYWWHLPGYNFEQNWNGGGNVWTATLCAAIGLAAWWRVAAVERGLNRPMRQHLATCAKTPDANPVRH